MENQALFRKFNQLPAVRDLPSLSANIILSLRFSVACHKAQHDPLMELARRWGGQQPAQRLRIMIEAIGQIWPDPFALAPPCCSRLSFDEALLASLITAAAQDDRRKFDGLSADMLNGDARELLFRSVENFIQSQIPSYRSR